MSISIRTRLAIGGAIVAASSLFVWSLRASGREVEAWRASLTNMPRIEAKPSPRFSASYTTTRARLWNDVLHLDSWTMETARELDAIARADGLSATPADDAPTEVIETWLLSREALHVIEARLNALAPVEPEARRLMLSLVLDSSRTVDRNRRHHACSALGGRGLFGEPSCRARLVELTNDPDSWVAKNARRHLAWAEQRGRTRDEDRAP